MFHKLEALTFQQCHEHVHMCTHMHTHMHGPVQPLANPQLRLVAFFLCCLSSAVVLQGVGAALFRSYRVGVKTRTPPPPPKLHSHFLRRGRKEESKRAGQKRSRETLKKCREREKRKPFWLQGVMSAALGLLLSSFLALKGLDSRG